MLLSSEVDSGVMNADEQLDIARRLRRQKKPIEASRVLVNALRENPLSANIYAELGMTLFGLGLMDRALAALQEASRLEPDAAYYRLNLSGIYHHTGRFEDCIEVASRLVKENPAFGLAHMNLGLSYAGLRNWKFSLEHFEQAVQYLPDHCGAWLNLGLGYENRCDDDKANACFEKAVALEPNNSKAWICLGTNNLRRGCFKKGWEQFSKRFDMDNSLALQGETPVWRGESLAGRSIHILAEQGLGDLVQFIRFAESLSKEGAQVFVSVPHRLRELLETVPGVAKCYSSSKEVPTCDYQSTVMELPRWLGIDETNIPLAEGYLRAEQPSAQLLERFAALGDTIKVGIVWSGNPKHINDSRRSMSFLDVEPLLDVPNTSLINLQLGTRATQLRDHPRSNEVYDWMHDDMNASETASLISQLDVVITVDTFVAHLAGALNIPTWICLPHSPDWRWLTEREDSPWYRSVRLFRQDESRTWDHVSQELVRALREAF